MPEKNPTPRPEPAFKSFFGDPEKDDLSSHLHRLTIGGLGALLPGLIWFMAGLRPLKNLSGWRPLDSVSAYYHTGAVAAFVGVLAALAVYFFTYRGYANKDKRWDRIAAIIAGATVLGVAFFPTTAPAGAPVPDWWTPLMRQIHYVSAVVLFGAFIFYALVLFPKSDPHNVALPSAKRWRNRLYRFCGGTMVVCMAWAGWSAFHDGPIFWPETFALEFFALSWLVKGRADWTAGSALSRAKFYGRHPAQFVGAVRRSFLG